MTALTNYVEVANQEDCQELISLHLLYAWSPSISAAQQSEFSELFLSLEQKIKGVLQVHVYKLSKSKDHYDLYVIIIFNSTDALIEYQQHTVHQDIIKMANSITKRYTYFQHSR